MITTLTLFLFAVITVESSPFSTYSPVQVQDCTPAEWVECGLDIGECAVDCTLACISCIEESFKQCIGCLTAEDVIKRIESFNNDSGVHSKEMFFGSKTTKPTVQGCTLAEWLKCGETIAKCGVMDCVKTCGFCIANTLVKCLSCIPAMDVVKNIEYRKSGRGALETEKLSGLKTKDHVVVAAQKCKSVDVAACAAVIAGCAAVCSEAEVDAPACIACMGGSYSTCKDCF